MRTLNLRFAGILAVIVVILMVTVYFVHGRQLQSNADFFYQEAKRERGNAATAAAQGDLAEKARAENRAVEYLGWYVQLSPDKLDALEELAQLLAAQAQQGDVIVSPSKFIGAKDLLENLVRRDPKRSEARRQLVTMCMRIARYQDAKPHIEELLKDAPKDAALRETLGQCQAALAEYDQARASFEKAIEDNPAQYTAYTRLAALLRTQYSLPTEADAVMDRLVNANPKAYQAYLQRTAYLYPQIGRQDDALRDLAKALELAPDNIDVLRLAAQFALVQGKADETLKYTNRGLQIDPTAVSMYALASRAQLFLGASKTAIELLRQGLKATNGKILLWMDLIDLLFNLNQLDDAKTAIEEFKAAEGMSEYNKKQYLDYANARLQFAEGKWLAACQGFEAARKSSFLKDSGRLRDANIFAGFCYERLGNVAQEEMAYRRALEEDPNYQPAQTALVNVLRRRGQVDEAMDRYRQLSVHDSQDNANLQWLTMLFQKIMQQQPAQRDWPALEAAIAKAAETLPDKTVLLQLRAEMLLQQGRGDEAERVLQEAAAQSPTKAELWLALASAATLQRHWDTVESALGHVEKLLPDGAALRLTRANYLLRRYGQESSGPLEKLTFDVSPLSEPQQLALWSSMLDLATPPQLVDRLCQKILEKDPNNLKVRGIKLLAAIRANDKKRIAAALDSIQQVAGVNSYWYLYGQAVLTSMGAKDSKDPINAQQQALAYLRKARESRPRWLPIALAEATIYEQLGDSLKAAQRYSEAIDLGERDEAFVVRLMHLLLQNGQFAAAHQQFIKLKQDLGRVSPRLALLAGEAALQQQDFEEVNRLIEQLSSLKDYRAQLWLSRAHKALGDHAKTEKQDAETAKQYSAAEQALRRAIALEPQIPQAWITLVDLFQQTGQPTEAERVVAELSKKLSPRNAAITAARCYEVLGKPDLAQPKYDQALAVAPDDLAVILSAVSFYGRQGNLKKAEALLVNVMDGKKPLEGQDLLGVRRQLAQIYTARGGYHNLEKADKLLSANLAVDKNSVLDLRLKAQVDMRHSQRNRRLEAANALEQLIQAKQATAEDRFQLAQLQLSLDNWSRANELFRGLVADNGKEPRYWTAYIEALLLNGALSDAELSIAQLESLTQETPTTVGFKVDLQSAANDPKSALALLKQYIEAVDRQSPEHDQRMRFAANKLDQVSRKITKPEQEPMARMFASYADLMYREYAKKSPRDQLSLATFLARQGKFDDAIAIIRQHGPECSPNDILTACISLMETQRLQPAHMEVLDAVVESQLRKSERTMVMLHLLATLRVYEGRYAEAEAVYREVLANYGDAAPALNNLAILLAQQGIKVDEALTLINRAIELEGPEAQLLDTRAIVYMAQHKYDLALKEIDAALEDKETAVRLFHKAQILAAMSRDDEVAATMLAAIRKGLRPTMLDPLELPAYNKLVPPSAR